MAEYEKKVLHDAPRPDILSPWRRRLSLPIPCHVHWPRSSCQSRARTAVIFKKACFRGPPGCMPGRVCSGRSCVRGARVRRGCAAGAWTPAWVRGGGAWRRGRAACVSRVPSYVKALTGRARGKLGVVVSSRSAGSSMRGRLGWWGVWWLFRGFYAGRRLGHCVTAKVGAGAVQKGY